MKPMLRTLVPRPVRDRLRGSEASLALQRALVPRWKRFLRRGASHDEIYGDDYFAMIDETSRASAEAMADSIRGRFAPGSVVDVGCGTGALILHLRELGIAVRGLEHAQSALRYCRERGLDVVETDLLDPGLDGAGLGSRELAVCQEVAHQLPPEAAPGLVALLCRLAGRVLFSSDSGGSDRLPLNPQPPEYWIERFAGEGFRFDAAASEALRAEWSERGVAPWLRRFPMVFERRDTPAPSQS